MTCEQTVRIYSVRVKGWNDMTVVATNVKEAMSKVLTRIDPDGEFDYLPDITDIKLEAEANND